MLIISLASLITFFFSAKYALTGLVLSITGMYLANKSGKKLNVQAVQQLIEKLTREHYKAVRRNPGTVNRAEIIPQINELFKAELSLEDKVLGADAPLF